METITTLWTAIVSGATAAATQTVLDQPIRAAYANLKEAITQKWSRLTDLLDAIRRLEAKPDSQARQALLREELESSAQSAPALFTDPALLAAAGQLLTLLGQPGNNTTVTAGDRGVAIGGSVSGSQISTGDHNRTIQTDQYIERQRIDRQIDTGGGSYINGNVDTSGGDFVGRDKK